MNDETAASGTSPNLPATPPVVAQTKKTDENGFFTMIICLIIILIAAVWFVYKRVQNAQ